MKLDAIDPIQIPPIVERMVVELLAFAEAGIVPPVCYRLPVAESLATSSGSTLADVTELITDEARRIRERVSG